MSNEQAIYWRRPDERPDLDREVFAILLSGTKVLLSVDGFKEDGEWMFRSANHSDWKRLPLGIDYWCYSEELPLPERREK